MSNFSNIGFAMTTLEEFYQLLSQVQHMSRREKVIGGYYSIYTDQSGAELYTQFNGRDQCIGMNPHYKGKSARTVFLTNSVSRTNSELDGAFHCWADPSDTKDPESGDYPFVFDVPNFKSLEEIEFPKLFQIQLSAFAQELTIYDSEETFDASQTSELKFAPQSFIPTGLFSFEGKEDPEPPGALGTFTGVIKEYERKRNFITGQEFFWLLIDTLSGDVDVVADMTHFDEEPKVNGVVQGTFWLSGRPIDGPVKSVKHKSFLKRIFGQ